MIKRLFCSGLAMLGMVAATAGAAPTPASLMERNEQAAGVTM